MDCRGQSATALSMVSPLDKPVQHYPSPLKCACGQQDLTLRPTSPAWQRDVVASSLWQLPTLMSEMQRSEEKCLMMMTIRSETCGSVAAKRIRNGRSAELLALNPPSRTANSGLLYETTKELHLDPLLGEAWIDNYHQKSATSHAPPVSRKISIYGDDVTVLVMFLVSLSQLNSSSSIWI